MAVLVYVDQRAWIRGVMLPVRTGSADPVAIAAGGSENR